jgi:phospholipid/cholesterol/gamma-HCH transport system ATP-binding protein
MAPGDGSEVMISLRGIRKRFGDNQVLDGVDLDIRAGETHVILGRSGTGKSVTLKLISGLMDPDAGRVEIGGRPLYPQPNSRRRLKHRSELLSWVQMLFQGAALFDSMDVAHNVAFHALEHGRIREAQVYDFASEYLQNVDLPDAGRLTPAELSGGMKKRVALARSLAAQPRIMLYDEPTTGLDPVTAGVINQLIRETQRRLGVTSVVVTHDLRSAMEVGDRCSFLDEGRILETTTPGQISQSHNGLVREFSEKAAVVL